MQPFDFWYAVNNTEVIVMPPRRLETFGTTTIDYHLVSEMMDTVNRVRVREGRIQAYRPEIIAPRHFMDTMLEGFSEEAASRYIEWLREHEQDLLVLRYGFKIRKDGSSENIVSDPIEAVLDRVKADVQSRGNPLAALVRGVEEPWEVCLLKLVVEMVQRSAPAQAAELRADPDGRRREIDAAFREASRDASRLSALADLLRRHDLFREYEDRFFALVRRHRRIP